MKWLSLAEGVELTPSTKRSIEAMDPYFEGEPSVVTSALRTAAHQLRIIIQKVARHGIGKDHPEWLQGIAEKWPIDQKVNLPGLGMFYWWQMGWSHLLHIGDVVNPPIPACVLMDYWRPGDPRDDAHNKKGQEIGVSNHMRGNSFDIGGGPEGKRLNDKAKCVMRAKQEGGAFISGYLIERINNAVHIDVMPV